VTSNPVPQKTPPDGCWGEEHIASELKLKLGVRVSPRTVRKYLANYRGRTPDPSQRWLTLVHNHAQAIVSCDFFVVFTARFRILYVVVIMELGRRQILHHNVTAHPSAEWTLQQFREALTEEHPYRFLIHDRDSIFSKDLDQAVTAMGVRILKTPMRAPKANAFCERLVGTIRRERLDFLILLGERHLKQFLTQWVTYYNHARVHTSLGPGIPSPIQPSPPTSGHRHDLPAGHVIRARQCSVDCTTSTGWRRWPHEARIEFLRTTMVLIPQNNRIGRRRRLVGSGTPPVAVKVEVAFKGSRSSKDPVKSH